MSLLADLILIVHFLFVLFVVGGLAVIWIGAWAGWEFVRNFWFRLAHFFAIAFVAGESLLGIVCPLTEWEDALRGGAQGAGFVQRWVHRLLYYNFPEWVFTVIYVLFALVVLATFWVVRPHAPRRKSGSSA